MIVMIYPEQKLVTEKDIRVWLSDCIDNGEIDTDLQTAAIADIFEAMDLLEDTGKFTFSR